MKVVRAVGLWAVGVSCLWGAGLTAVLAQTEDVNDMPGASIVRRFRPPQVDLVRFQPMPADHRLLNEPKIKLLARKDGYEFCSRITGAPISATSRPMACAYWNVKRRECTVVTPEVTGFNYVGHEVRHCFEGAFHD
ncbi:MAG: hypothetical protein AAB176_01400 [Pseudomonadota bacterium]|jgi:hypothetical protein